MTKFIVGASFKDSSIVASFFTNFAEQFAQFESYRIELENISVSFSKFARIFDLEQKRERVQEEEYTLLIKYETIDGIDYITQFEKEEGGYDYYEEQYQCYYKCYIPVNFVNLFYATQGFKDYNTYNIGLNHDSNALYEINRLCSLTDDHKNGILKSLEGYKHEVVAALARVKDNKKTLNKYVAQYKNGVEGSFEKMKISQKAWDLSVQEHRELEDNYNTRIEAARVEKKAELSSVYNAEIESLKKSISTYRERINVLEQHYKKILK